MECQRDEKTTNSRHRQSNVDGFFFGLKIRSYLYCDFEQNFGFLFSLCLWTRVNQNGKPEKKWNSKYVLAISNRKKRMLLCPSVCTDSCVGVFACLFVFVVAAVVVFAMGTVKIENIQHLHRTLKSHLHANSLYAVSNIIHN